jgi:hypothetical protein
LCHTAPLEDCRARHKPKDEEKHKGDDKDEEKDFSNPGSGDGNAGETEQTAIIETMKKNNANLSILSLRWAF